MPPAVSSFRTRALLVVGTLLFLVIFWWSTRPDAKPARFPTVRQPALAPARSIHPATLPRLGAPKSDPADQPTAAEVVAYVTAIYRHEQLTRELDLEQRRYGNTYWQSDRDGAELARIRADRAALIAELGAEANAVLATELGPEAGAAVTLTPFFDDDHPAPNLTYLSPRSREAFEAEVLAVGANRREQFADIATATLSPAELAQYHAWNDRASAALRTELVGFDASEAEFQAILHTDRSGEAVPEIVAANLATQLGAERYQQLVQLENPAMLTAVHDLNRAGLPLTFASWLATTRQNAMAAIQQVWQDNTLSDANKSDRVSALQRTYGQSISATLGRPVSNLDELGAAP